MSLDWPLTIYLLLTVVPWLLLWLGYFLATSRMSRLRGRLPALPAPAPSVSIVVPAKDESSHIETCVSKLLEQDYPALELVVIDDRSTDGTRDVLNRLVAQNPSRLKSFHVDALPEGWLEKRHALHVGTRDIASEWILFVDSDVALEPNATSAAVALAAGRGYDAMSMINRINARTFWERLMIPVLGATWSAMFFVSVTNNDNRPTVAAANGQFFLIRRSAYEKVGGHAGVRNEIVEDVELMRRLKSSGHKCRLMIGTHLASTHMHATLVELKRGWGRIFAGTASYRPARIWLAIIALIVGGLSVYPAIAFGLWRWLAGGDWRWIAAAGAHFLLMTSFLATVYRGTKCRPTDALLAFISLPVTIWLLIEGLKRCRDKRFEWRGTAVTIR